MISDKEKLESMGWIITCLSPLEIRHDNGGHASGLAAQYAMDGIIEDYEPQHNLKPYNKAEAILIEDIEAGIIDYFEASKRCTEIFKLIPFDAYLNPAHITRTMQDYYGEEK